MLREREDLYRLTKNMSGRLRTMLKGYNRETGAPVASSKAHNAYTADPKSRYHDADFHDAALVNWALAARGRAACVGRQGT